MKFVTYENKAGIVRAGFLVGEEKMVDLFESSNGILPDNMLDFLNHQDEYISYIEEHREELEKSAFPVEQVVLKAPLPNPRSIRDFYAFEQHVKTARHNRGLEMIPEWYNFPVFYFTNHLAVKGPEETIPRPKDCRWLDYELEIACVIGKKGMNIKADEADEYIMGYMIMNDWSARDIQREEMKVGLGPAKGKDFATSFGPFLVTKDELAAYRAGKGFNLEMKAKVNGQLLSNGNVKDLYYSFGEMIERASAGTMLFPGEVIGSGTVGTGCILELGTDTHRWLEPGDQIELEITALGVLKNGIIDG